MTRGLGVLLAFVLAKSAVLADHTIPWSIWTPIAYFWQDVFVALLCAVVFALLAVAGAKRHIGWSIYWALVAYAALNIPIGRALSTPLTWPMLRATRGAIFDSLAIYVTWTNVLLIALTIAAAMVPASLVPRTRMSTGASTASRSVAFAFALLFVAIGPKASARIDTAGFERNIISTLVTSALPHVTSHRATDEWRTSPFSRDGVEDLSALRGIAKGRNVVLVALESTAAQYLKLYGGPDDLTPNLDALARESLIFEHAYSPYPESIKGLFSLLCSTYPAFDSTPAVYERVPCRSPAAILAQAKYRTGLFHSGRFGYLGMDAVIRNRGYHTLEDAGDIGGNHNSSFGVDEPSTVDRMLSWIDARPNGEQFFLTYLPIAGHHPYQIPEPGPLPGDTEFDHYRNALHYADASLGALAEGLRERGLREKTLWIILGDHGEAFGQHEGNFGHTFFLYDENVHLPFIVAAPGLLEERRVGKVISLVDTAPTMLDLMGLSAPEEYQGRSALEYTHEMALFLADYSIGMMGLRDREWKYIYELDSGRSKLFDLTHDPLERSDVSAGHRDRTDWYRHNLQRWSAAQKSLLTEPRPQARTEIPRPSELMSTR